jgi:hypothetical protein
VIQTPLAPLTDTAVRVLLQALQTVEAGQTPVLAQPFILPFEIYTSENV